MFARGEGKNEAQAVSLITDALVYQYIYFHLCGRTLPITQGLLFGSSNNKSCFAHTGNEWKGRTKRTEKLKRGITKAHFLSAIVIRCALGG